MGVSLSSEAFQYPKHAKPHHAQGMVLHLPPLPASQKSILMPFTEIKQPSGFQLYHAIHLERIGPKS